MLDCLEGWTGSWMGWIAEYQKNIAKGISHETIMAQEEEISKRNQNSPFICLAPLSLIHKNLIEIQGFLNSSFLPMPVSKNLSRKAQSAVEATKRENLIPLQVLRCKLLQQVKAIVLSSQEKADLTASLTIPAQLIFRFPPLRADFSPEWNRRFRSFQVSRTNMGFTALNSEPRQKILGQIFEYQASTPKKQLRAVFILVKEQRILRGNLALCQRKLHKLKEDPETLGEICTSFRFSSPDRSKGLTRCAEVIGDKLHSAIQDLHIEVARFEMLIFQAIDKLFFNKNTDFSFSITDFLGLMAWSSSWQQSQFKAGNIPSIFFGKPRLFLEQLAKHYTQMPAIETSTGESLNQASIVFFDKITASSSLADRKLTLCDFISFLSSFESYIAIEAWVSDMRSFLKKSLSSMQDEPEQFSYEELIKLRDFLEAQELLKPLKVAENLLESCHQMMLENEAPEAIVAQSWIKSLEILLEARQPRLDPEPAAKPEIEISLTSTNMRNVFENSSDALETSVLETLSAEAPTPKKEVREVSEEELDNEFSSVLSESIRLIQQERERSFNKRAQQARLSRSVGGGNEQDLIPPEVSVRGIQKLDPGLLRQLRDPRKFQKYITQAGLNLLSEGRSHRELSDGTIGVWLPRHPGKDISPGVRHKIIKTLTTRS